MAGFMASSAGAWDAMATAGWPFAANPACGFPGKYFEALTL